MCLLCVQELFVEKYRDQVMSFWEEFSADMVSKVPSMTLDNFKYARGLVSATSDVRLTHVTACQMLN